MARLLGRQGLICNWPLSVKMWPLSVLRWNANSNHNPDPIPNRDPNPIPNPNPNLTQFLQIRAIFTHTGLTPVSAQSTLLVQFGYCYVVLITGTAVSRSCGMTLKTTRTADWTSSHAVMRSSGFTCNQMEPSTLTSGVLALRPSTSVETSVSYPFFIY